MAGLLDSFQNILFYEYRLPLLIINNLLYPNTLPIRLSLERLAMTSAAIRKSPQLLVLFALAVVFLTELGPRTVSGATPLTFVANGTVDFVPPELAGTFSIGDPFTVIYTFDADTPDGNASLNVGDYLNALTDMVVNVGPYGASGTAVDFTSGKISVVNNVGGDAYRIDVAGLVGPDVGGLPLASQNPILQLSDPTATATTSDALPTTPPDPADYVSASTFLALKFGGLDAEGEDFVSIEATLDSIEVLKRVGGVTSFERGSGSSAGSIALLAGGAATLLAIAAAGGWYTRRRWLSSRSYPLA